MIGGVRAPVTHPYMRRKVQPAFGEVALCVSVIPGEVKPFDVVWGYLSLEFVLNATPFFQTE